jgi:uncharacterized membrane protein
MDEADSRAPDSPRARLRRRLYVAASIIALFGLADGIYLTIEHVTGRTAQCIASSGCQEVLASEYAAFGPVPLAAVGAFAYFTVFCAALLASFGYPKCGPFFALVVTIMFGVTLWLFYLQAFVLHAFCDYCLFSAGVTTVLTVIALTSMVLRPRS